MGADLLASTRRFGALTAVVLGLSLTAGAQQRPPSRPQATFRAGVELIQIDVVVVDAEGRHIRGLTRDDFAVTDKTKPQTIAAFEEVSHERRRAALDAAPAPAPVRMDVASNQSVQAHRLVVMVIDDLHIYRGRAELSKNIARGVLDKLGADASMAVLFTSGEHSTEVTEDRSVLLGAVDTLTGRKAVRRPTAARDTQRMAAGGGEGGRSLGEVQAAQDSSVQDFFDNMSKYKALEDAARLLGQGDARRKAFVLVSEGIAKDVTGVFDAATTPCDAKCARCPCYHEIALRNMMNSLRRSNVVTYAIDPRGHVSTQDLALELFPSPVGFDVHDPLFFWHNPVRAAQNGLRLTAEASGGFAIVDTDNFLDGVDRIIEDLDHYYLLGFYPNDPGKKGYRPLDVSVPAHPEWRVRFRKGYRAEGPPKPAVNKNPLAALMSGALPDASLALRLQAIPLGQASGGDMRVALAFEVSVPRAGLEEADGKLRDELTYEVVVVDQTKAKVRSLGGLTAKVTLSPTAAGGRAAPDVATYQVAQTIALPPGRFQLRLAAESSKLSRGGSVYLHLVVPDMRRDEPSIGGIAVGYAGGSRIAAAVAAPPPVSPAQRAARMAVAAPPPALPFAPTLDREFAAGDLLRVYFEVSARERREPAAGMIEILNADGTAARPAQPFTADDRGRVDQQLSLADLPPGAYILRAHLTGGPKAEIGISVGSR